MKLTQQTILYFRQGNSDKVYEIDLCEINPGEYVVNFRYGRRGAQLREGTKTIFPIPLDQAKKIFEDLAQSKIKKGYSSDISPQRPDNQTEPDIPHIDQESLQGRLIQYLKKITEHQDTGNWPHSRILWRIGEAKIKSAEPTLLKLNFGSKSFDNLALAWALGRCGSEIVVSNLEKIPISSSPTLVRLQRCAIMDLGNEERKTALANIILDELPQSLEGMVQDQKYKELHTALRELLFQKKAPNLDLLTPLYQVLPKYPELRPIVLKILSEIPFIPGHFRSIRYIFKLSEFRDDAAVQGLLIARMNQEKCYYTSPSWGRAFVEGEYLDISKEMEQKTPKTVWSSKTKHYFSRRVIRWLERLSQLNPDYFIDLASSICLHFGENDKKEPVQKMYYGWDYGENTSINYWQVFPSFSSQAVLGYILYRNSPRYEMRTGNLSWIFRRDFDLESPIPEDREEAFPNLWDQKPGALANLLINSKHQLVLEFALKAFKVNPQKEAHIDRKLIIALLNKAYSNCQSFGIELATNFFDPTQPDVDLLLHLLQCPLEAAQSLATNWLVLAQSQLLSEPRFLWKALFVPSEILRNWYSQNVKSRLLKDKIAEKVVRKVFEKLQKYGDWKANPLQLASDFVSIFQKNLATIPLEWVLDLLKHSADQVQELGAKILLIHEAPVEQISPEIIETLIESKNPQLRSLGVQLFGKMPVEILKNKKDILTNFCISRHPEIRQHAGTIMAKLLDSQPDFGLILLELFLPMLWRKETYPGVQKDLFELIQNQLSIHFPSIKQDIAWKLIRAPYGPANNLGTLLFHQNLKTKELSFREWVELGNHEVLSLREAAWEFYKDNVALCKTERNEAIRLLNSGWEDCRKFAMEYFQQNFGPEDWDPITLVGICDSIRPDIQDYGKKLITRFFEEKDGLQYMLKLAQHPNTHLQQFVANYLERFASGSLDRISQMEFYFLSVLSQVNKGRVAKERIFHFLQKESLQDQETAKQVIEWLSRIVPTIAIKDKARCIEILSQLRGRYPELNSPLTLTKLETK